MKILFCTNKFEEVVNGPAKFANLALDINELYPEHEIHILTEDVSEPKPFVHKLELRYPKVLRLFSHVFRIMQYHKEASRLRQNEFPFDIIVYNNSFIGLLSALKWQNTVGMINDDNNASKNWKDFQLQYTYIKQFIFKQAERLSVRYHQKIITNSNYLTQFLESIYPALDKSFRLYKAIELPEELKPLDRDLGNKEKIHVLFVKADFVRGGLFTLISACKTLNKKIAITVIGPENHFGPEIEESLRGIGNLEILFIGTCNQDRVFQEMLNADIFCVPAHKEALGVANLEALSRCVPVVSSNTGGIPEVLNYGECGWMAAPEDPEDLARVLTLCIENTDERIGKIMAGIKYSRNFSKDKVLANFIKILKK